MTTITLTDTYTRLHCANCGTPFAITTNFEQRRRDDHRAFYCPSGHSNVFNAETEAERLRKKLRAAELEAERNARAVADANAETERLKRRVACGTCPCCQRTFKQLAAHMRRKHPTYQQGGKK